jgi:hypothetical protein
VRSSRRARTSQIVTVPLLVPVAIMLASGLKAIVFSELAESGSRLIRPLLVSHSSPEANATVLPSGL